MKMKTNKEELDRSPVLSVLETIERAEVYNKAKKKKKKKEISTEEWSEIMGEFQERFEQILFLEKLMAIAEEVDLENLPELDELFGILSIVLSDDGIDEDLDYEEMLSIHMSLTAAADSGLDSEFIVDDAKDDIKELLGEIKAMEREL